MRIARSVRKLEYALDLRTKKFVLGHPFLGFLSVFIGIPVFILVCVCASTVAVAFPIAWLFGWL
ncbi:MAG: hypothetical protein J6C33_04820 [Lachnospiraceae bacterium]|nr:hypothetical protein [Lachnospiraceae bacterium]